MGIMAILEPFEQICVPQVPGEIWNLAPTGFRGENILKCWQTIDAWLYYKLTFQPSAQAC